MVECVCELPKEDEFSLAKLYKTKSLESDDRGDKSSKKVDERPTLDLGTLVRVVGKITEPWQSEWDRTVLVEEIRESPRSRCWVDGAELMRSCRAAEGLE